MTARWQTVPVDPTPPMVRAFAVETRRQAARLAPGSTAHEPLGPLWAAVLKAAPPTPPPDMPRTATDGWNAALAAVIALARSSAGALQARITERPTRYGYAIAALEALADEAEAMVIRPPDEPEPAATAGPRPRPSGDGGSAQVQPSDSFAQRAGATAREAA